MNWRTPMIGIIAIILIVGLVASRAQAEPPKDPASSGGVGDPARDAFCDLVGGGAQAAESAQTGSPPTTDRQESSDLCNKVFGTLEGIVVDGLNPVLQGTLGVLVEEVGLSATGQIKLGAKITGDKVRAALAALRAPYITGPIGSLSVARDFVIWVDKSGNRKLEVGSGLYARVCKSKDVISFHMACWLADSRPSITNTNALSAFEHNAIENIIVANAARAAAFDRLYLPRYQASTYMDREGVDLDTALMAITMKRYPNAMGNTEMITLYGRIAEQFPGLDPLSLFTPQFEQAVAKGFEKVWAEEYKIGSKQTSAVAKASIKPGAATGTIVKREEGKPVAQVVNQPKVGATVAVG